MAMGVYQALVVAGKDERGKVCGFDGADDVVKLISERGDGSREAPSYPMFTGYGPHV